MKLNIVSDVHYRTTGLAAAGQDCDLFVCLGDLVLFLDYDDPVHGIFAETFGADNARRYIRLRYQLRFDEARSFSRELWEALGADPWTVISQQVARQYEQIFAVMPPGLLTYGNVDVPALWADHVQPHHEVLDGQVRTVGGLTFGFVGGGLRTPMRTPFEISDEEYASKVTATSPRRCRTRPTTSWPDGWNAAVPRCWSTSATSSRDMWCTVMCTSPCSSASASGAPRSSMWGTSGRADVPTP